MQFLESMYGGLLSVQPLAVTLSVVVVLLVLGYTGAPLWVWALAGAAALYGFGAPLWGWIVFGTLVLLFGVPPLRRMLLTTGLVKILKALNVLPVISDTERTAIEAGNTWIDGELFSGKPDFKRLLNEPYPDLTKEEQDFLAGPKELGTITVVPSGPLRVISFATTALLAEGQNS